MMVMVLFLVAHPLIKLVYFHVQNYYEETALFNACRCGHAETAKVLLDRGAIVDYQDDVRVRK